MNMKCNCGYHEIFPRKTNGDEEKAEIKSLKVWVGAPVGGEIFLSSIFFK